MRSQLRVSIICIVVGLVFSVPAKSALAQSARDIINMFGAIVQSTMAQAAQAEWRKLAPAAVSCVDQTLRQRGISLQALINNGIAPSDSRVSYILASCRSQANTDFYRTVVNPSKYSVDNIGLGNAISLGSASYNEYQCRPSDQFEGFTWCQKEKTERDPRGAYLSHYSMLHSADGRAYYLNRYLEPAFFAPGEVESDIDRLSRKFREQPRLLRMPRGANSLMGLVAYWGEVVVEPLDASATARLAAGQSPGVGILLDFNANPQQSIRQGLPVYRITGGPGFVWAESHSAGGVGRLRFFAIDPSSLSATSNISASSGMPNSADSMALPSDAWKDCQSRDTETRLGGCTKVIDAKSENRIRLADAFDGRCSAYAQKQQYDLALADCKSAIDLNPKYSYAYANLGETYVGLNEPPRVCRRPFGISYAAMAGCSSMA
jgi:tetratricopeptide (TPR) repeat protein